MLDSAAVGLAVVQIDRDKGHAVAYETLVALEENLIRPLEEGFGMGEDERDVYRDALHWWDAELSRIESSPAWKP